MQDRRRQFDEIFLQRTAGPYIRVIRVGLAGSRDFRSTPVNGRSQNRRAMGSSHALQKVCESPNKPPLVMV
jgi:hypothetical protein